MKFEQGEELLISATYARKHEVPDVHVVNVKMHRDIPTEGINLYLSDDVLRSLGPQALAIDSPATEETYRLFSGEVEKPRTLSPREYLEGAREGLRIWKEYESKGHTMFDLAVALTRGSSWGR